MNEWTPHDPDTARALLAGEHAAATARIHSLRRQLTSIREISTWTSTDDEHDPEGSTIAYERAQVQGLLADAQRELDAVRRATERVDEGTYGLCENCGKVIALERLRALPATATCIACATRPR